jgi:pilus assembly protein Flp/PilA
MPQSIGARLDRFLAAEDGPAAVEYAVMLALIVAVCASVLGTLGVNANAVCNVVCTALR